MRQKISPRLRRELRSPLRGPPALRLRLRGRGSGFAPIPPRHAAAPHPSPTPVRRFAATWEVYRLRTAVLGLAPVLRTSETSQVAAKRRTAVLRTRLAPPRWAGCPPHRSSTGLPPPARRVPPNAPGGAFLPRRPRGACSWSICNEHEWKLVNRVVAPQALELLDPAKPHIASCVFRRM